MKTLKTQTQRVYAVYQWRDGGVVKSSKPYFDANMRYPRGNETVTFPKEDRVWFDDGLRLCIGSPSRYTWYGWGQTTTWEELIHLAFLAAKLFSEGKTEAEVEKALDDE